MPNFLIPASKYTGLKTAQGYTEQSTLPMTLFYGQPNNVAKMNFKLESVMDLSDAMIEVLKERSNALDFVMRETLEDIKGFFQLETKLAYEITAVPYAKLATVRLQNIVGLKANLKEYAFKLDEALTMAINVLEFELPSLTKLIAQLLTSRDALTSTRPISALADLQMYTQHVDVFKEELGKMVGHEANNPYVTFGEVYYSLGEWKDCNKLIFDVSNRLKKIKAKKYDKDIKNATGLLDKLIMRCQEESIPKTNIQVYATLIEQTSSNIAFAGATIHMCQTLIQTFQNHNEVLKVEVDDYRKHNK